MFVAVGSTNPVKIKATLNAFKMIFGDDIYVKGFKVSSNVRPTPRSDKEMIFGAKNRVKQLLKLIKADFYVGHEGGIVVRNGNIFVKGWVAIYKENIWSLAATVEVPLPNKIIDMLKSDKTELEELLEKITHIRDLGEKQGAIGFFTRGFYTRMDAFRDATICALSKFLLKKIYCLKNIFNGNFKVSL